MPPPRSFLLLVAIYIYICVFQLPHLFGFQSPPPVLGVGWVGFCGPPLQFQTHFIERSLLDCHVFQLPHLFGVVLLRRSSLLPL